MFLIPWLPWPWGQVPEDPILASSIFFGIVVVVIGVLYVVGGILRSERGPLSWFISRDIGGVLTTALVIGLALGLGTSLVFDLVAGSVAEFSLPDNLLPGLAMGLGCGIIVGCALGRIGRLPWGIVLGSALGLIVGLALFRRIFGPTAGFGYETDQGVGTEVGLAFGLILGLASALVCLLIGRLLPVSGTMVEDQRRRSRPTGCPAPLPAQVGLVSGLGIFTLGGSLMGGLASAPTRFRSWAGGVSWSRVIAIAAFGTGLAAGLDTRLHHSYIGGPSVPGLVTQTVDPAAGGLGLVCGLSAGLALGIVCAVLMRLAEQPSRRRALLVGAVLIVLGLVMWSLTAWWVPLTFINIP